MPSVTLQPAGEQLCLEGRLRSNPWRFLSSVGSGGSGRGQKLSIASSKDGWPKSPILKVGFDPAELSPWPLIWDENRPATATSLDFFDEAQPILWQGLSQSSIGDR